MPLEVHAPFEPMGDQIKAIETLTKGFGNHEKKGTLIGVTGSGKSLDYEEKITLIVDGKIQRVKIGEFVQSHLTAPTRAGDTLYQNITGPKTPSFDPSCYTISNQPITQVSMHLCDELFYIKLEDGSEIRVTADHNCFRVKGESLELVTTKSLNVGDLLPVASSFPAPTDDLGSRSQEVSGTQMLTYSLTHLLKLEAKDHELILNMTLEERKNIVAEILHHKQPLKVMSKDLVFELKNLLLQEGVWSHVESYDGYYSLNYNKQPLKGERRLSAFVLSPIVSIEKIEPSDGFVYDIAVEQNENFMAGYGNIYVHNTFTASKIIEKLNLPTLVMAHNKTLAAQLYAEFREFFPTAAVEYFVSFYDYYQPESYIPTKDLYIDKDFSINEEIEKLRNSTTKSLAMRDDVIVIASVSAIYNVGLPKTYRGLAFNLKVGQEFPRDDLLRYLVKLLYSRNEMELKPKTFRAKGDIVEILPIYQDMSIRIEYFGDEIEALSYRDPLTGKNLEILEEVTIFPGSQYLTTDQALEKGLVSIREELIERHEELLNQGKLVEAQRLLQRTNYDMEQLREFGYCKGIENYSRHFDGREPGEPPYTLLDHFPENYLLVVDESHATLPQIRAMYGGDFSRKQNLVNFGFRLPSAYDNRPLKFEEFEKRMPFTLFMSATPGDYELKNSTIIAEQIIRPTGLLEPRVDVRQTSNQIDDVILEIQRRIEMGQRSLINTLTVRMAENLTDFLMQAGVKTLSIHADVDTIKRVEILQKLRTGEIDVIVGVNLLREGLDLPEVGMVAILDADKEGFLRSRRSLIQIMGRAARNVDGEVILYADKITDSLREAVTEVNRRRRIQEEYNKKHGITPKTVVRGMQSVIDILKKEKLADMGVNLDDIKDEMSTQDIYLLIDELQAAMTKAAEDLEFELAAELRDRIKDLKMKLTT